MTIAKRFKELAKKYMPNQSDLRDLDDSINCTETIDDLMWDKSEYLGGMASFILAIIDYEETH